MQWGPQSVRRLDRPKEDMVRLTGLFLHHLDDKTANRDKKKDDMMVFAEQ